jgi:hypothetical protein
VGGEENNKHGRIRENPGPARSGHTRWTTQLDCNAGYYHSTGRSNNERKEKIDLNKEKENEGRECRECDWGRGWRLGRGEEEERLGGVVFAWRV